MALADTLKKIYGTPETGEINPPSRRMSKGAKYS